LKARYLEAQSETDDPYLSEERSIPDSVNQRFQAMAKLPLKAAFAAKTINRWLLTQSDNLLFSKSAWTPVMAGKPRLFNLGGCRRSVCLDDRVGCSMTEWQLLETGFCEMNVRKLSGSRPKCTYRANVGFSDKST
jgi:hypothetical protein